MKARQVTVLMAGPTSPPRNGMSVTTDSLVACLPQHGIVLHLVDTADRRGLGNVGRLDARNVFAAMRHGCRWAWMLLAKRPDVAYVPIAQNSLGFLRDALFLLPARMLRCRVVVHLHGCSFQAFYRDASPPMRWLVRTALKKVVRAIVLGQSALMEFDGLVPRDRVCVVENGVSDLADGAPAGRESRLCGDRYTVAYLGSLKPEKGFLELLKAVALLDDSPGLRFVFAGEFTSAAAERKASSLVADLKLQDRVEFIGPVGPDDAAALLSGSLALVMPAVHTEGQPLVILEAFRSGTPVIATRSGCISETVCDGENGFLISPYDPSAIADALRRLSADSVLWRTQSEIARGTYEERFRLERWVDEVAAVLTQAAGVGRKTPSTSELP